MVNRQKLHILVRIKSTKPTTTLLNTTKPIPTNTHNLEKNLNKTTKEKLLK
jgi:hypothetical protein